MTRRTKFSRDGSPHRAIDLWSMRLMQGAKLWEDVAVNEMYDCDVFPRYAWFRALRDEINFAFIASANAAFLETGRADAIWLPQHDCRREADKDGGKAPDEGSGAEACEIVGAETRIARLREASREAIEDEGSLFDFPEDTKTPSTLGAYWKRIARGSLVKRWLGSAEPQSLQLAVEKLEGEFGSDDIAGLDEPLRSNLREIGEAFGFGAIDLKIFAFIIAASCDTPLQAVLSLFDFSKAGTELAGDVLAAGLAAEPCAVRRALGEDSPLMRSGLVAVRKDNDAEFADRFRLLDPSRFAGLLSTRMSAKSLVESTVEEAPAPELSLADYGHVPAAGRVMLPYLRAALDGRRRGANILLYGMPGTGKTQLARAAAAALGAKLYEVATDAEGGSRDEVSRLRRWKTASAFLSNAPRVMIAIDEAEDVFNDGGSGPAFLFGRPARTNKGEINRLLETSPVPTFWITNAIDSIDPAMIRRFDVVLEVPPPDAAGRRRIVEKAFAGRLSERTAERFVQAERLAPAVLCRAAAVADLAGFGEGRVSEEDVADLVGETLRAQGYGAVPGEASLLPAFYDPALANADVDLAALPEGLRAAGGGRLCLYGPPGTGKSAYAAWLAKAIGRPLVRRTVAELTSCFVGETEKLIARAFAEAKRSGAVLLFDEADSFLRDRTLSRASWETTQVNEMLAQLEAFPGYFVATTNLLEALDPASLRRFDLKAKFGFLRPEQAVRLAERQLAQAGFELDPGSRSRILGWEKLTPGDFAAVARQSAFRPLRSAADFAARLAEELSLKSGSSGRIGFC